jgi:hypothetical protein
MSPVEWYYARGNKQMGPVSASELKRMAGAGEIHPDNLVWREGLTEWTAASNVRGLFEDEGKPAAVGETEPKAAAWAEEVEPAAEPEKTVTSKTVTSETAVPPPPAWHLLDVLLDSFRTDFNARFLETTANLFRDCGLYGLLLALLVTAAFTTIIAVKASSLGGLLSDFMLLFLLAALQYVAGKFCDILDRLNRTTRGTLSSTALPDCFALLCLVAGLTVWFGSVPMAVYFSMYSMILMGTAGFVVCVYTALVALNPSILNITIVADEARPSEEAVSVLVFLLKALLHSVPVALGAGVIAGTLTMGCASYEALLNDERLPAAQLTADAARAALIFSAALPLVAYLLSLLHYLLFDLCLAVLGLPDKLDRLARKGDGPTGDR